MSAITDATAAFNDAKEAFEAERGLIETARVNAIDSVSGHVNNQLIRAGLENLLTDSGRLYDDSSGIEKALWLNGKAFNAGFAFTHFNGSVIEEAGLFSHDNQNNGGAGIVMTEPAQSLAADIKGSARYGAEFYIARVIAGAGTASSGVSDAYRMITVSASTFVCYGTYTMSKLVRAEFGSIYLLSNVTINGVMTGEVTELTPADGWVHASVSIDINENYGYGWFYIPIYGIAGAKANIAMPWLSRGDFRGVVHRSPVPHANIYT